MGKNNRKINDDPPLNRTRLLALLFAILVVGFMVYVALRISKVPEIDGYEIKLEHCFLEATNEPIDYLQPACVQVNRTDGDGLVDLLHLPGVRVQRSIGRH